jgi:hypothetical protein
MDSAVVRVLPACMHNISASQKQVAAADSPPTTWHAGAPRNHGRIMSMTPGHVRACAVLLPTQATVMTDSREPRPITSFAKPMITSMEASVPLPPSRSEMGPPMSLPTEYPPDPIASSVETSAAE